MNHSWRYGPFLLLALCGAAGLAWGLPGAAAQAAEPRAFRPVNASPAPAAADSPLRWKKPSEYAVQQTAASERVATRSTRELPAPTHPAALDSSVAFGDGGPVSVAPHGQYFDPGYPGHPGHSGHPGYYGEGAPCGCDDGGGCYDACCGPECEVCLPCCWQLRDFLQVYGGVHGFKGPVDYPRAGATFGPNPENGGNFGFHEGFNVGLPICELGNGFAAQVGGSLYHSNLSGSEFDEPGGTISRRNTLFGTMGVFRRNDCGLQGGVVWDYMRDEYYHTVDLSQLRAEASFVCPNGRELGAWISWSERQELVPGVLIPGGPVGPDSIWQPTQQYNLFYRRTFENGANFRGWAGLTDRADIILGGEFMIPVGCSLALTGTANYLIPNENDNSLEARLNGMAPYQQEAWYVGINLVWFPGRARLCDDKCFWRYRPLFDVASPATFMVDRRNTD